MLRHMRCISCHTDLGVSSAEARLVHDPHHRQPALDELATPKVMFDIFFVGPDELAKRYKIVNGCFSLRDKERFLSIQELDQTDAVLNLIDCKTNARSSGAWWSWFLLDGKPQACRLLGAVDEEARWKTSSDIGNQGNWHGSERLTGTDRPDTMFATKTAMQHVSKPDVLMNARLQRLGRYYEGTPALVWCYPLQELPNGIRVDGDGDWAPTTELLRRSTSGGAVRYGLHSWDCYSVTEATIELSSAESEFYATGGATARGLQCNVYLSETDRPCELASLLTVWPHCIPPLRKKRLEPCSG